jgi:hypothetical protein
MSRRTKYRSENKIGLSFHLYYHTALKFPRLKAHTDMKAQCKPWKCDLLSTYDLSTALSVEYNYNNCLWAHFFDFSNGEKSGNPVQVLLL